MSFVLYSGNAKLLLAKLGNIKNKHVHVYWKALYTRTSTFTQKYVKYMHVYMENNTIYDWGPQHDV